MKSNLYGDFSKTLVVTNMQEMANVLDISINTDDSTTDLSDIDDDMGVGDIPADKVAHGVQIALTEKKFNIATITNELLDEWRKESNLNNCEWGFCSL